jgi:hypothetical protein
MSTRRAKQIIYAAFYLIVLFLIIWVIYALFIKAAPSCFDGKQDQGEQGIDCGGPCAAVCTSSAQPIAVISVQAFASGNSRDTFLAQIANRNSDLAAQSFDYAFNLYDASDTLLQSIPGQSFLYGKEIKYILLPNQSVPSNLDHITFTTANLDWVATSTFGPAPQLVAGNVMTVIGSSTLSANGAVTNNDTAAFNNVLIIALFNNAQGSAVGSSQTELDSIAPGQTQTFSIIYPAISGIDPAQTEIFVDAMRN